MAKGGPKQYPSLAAYLEMASKQTLPHPGRVAQAFIGVFGSLATVFAVGTLVYTLDRHSWANAVVAALPAFIIAGSFAIMAVLLQKVVPRRAVPTQLELEARDVNALLKRHLNERRLHKAGPEAVILLLEEISRQYLRVQASLASNFWRTPSLPEPYASLRDKAQVASNRAISEAVVMLRPRISDNAKPQHWKDVVDDVAETMGFKAADTGFVFPGDLEPARNLAEGMRHLANEVEQASIRAVTDIPNSASAESSLRSVLGELRSLNDAETELDQSLRYRT